MSIQRLHKVTSILLSYMKEGEAGSVQAEHDAIFLYGPTLAVVSAEDTWRLREECFTEWLEDMQGWYVPA